MDLEVMTAVASPKAGPSKCEVDKSPAVLTILSEPQVISDPDHPTSALEQPLSAESLRLQSDASIKSRIVCFFSLHLLSDETLTFLSVNKKR
jgi:hypothetical protein